MKASKFWNPGSFILGMLVLWIGCNNLQLNKELSNLDQANIRMKLDSTAFVQRLGEQGQLIAEQAQTILTSEQAKKLLTEELKDVKELKSQVKVYTRVQVDTIYIPGDSVQVVRIDSTDFMRLPAYFSYGSQHLQLDATVDSWGLRMDRLQLHNTTTVTVANFQKGFFRRSKPEVRVENTNPYFNTVGMTNIVIEDHTKWYNTRGFNIGLGFALGVLATR